MVELSPVPRLLVLGDPRHRETFAEQLAAVGQTEVTDCDPALGDCVMYVRLEAARYDGFVFLGYDHPVTRGALAVVSDRAVLIPLLEEQSAPPDPAHDGYLFRLPKAIGFRDEQERAAIIAGVPRASDVPSAIIGRNQLDVTALVALIDHAIEERWQWDDFVEKVERDVGGRRRAG